jgi:hypothetical protein
MAEKKNRTAISDEEIIAALISCGSISEAAAHLNMAPRTIYDRMGYREFKAAYSAAKADIVRQAVLTMGRNLAGAVDVVTEIMNDDGNPAATRLQAAKLIIDSAAKFTDRIAKAEEYTAEKAADPNDFDPAKW